jgi:hypothetical protein
MVAIRNRSKRFFVFTGHSINLAQGFFNSCIGKPLNGQKKSLYPGPVK